jgi:hypothetical protein
LWPEGSAQSIAIAAEQRVLDYRLEQWTVKAELLNSSKATRSLAALYSKYPSEQAVIRAWYVALGLQPDPPAGWTKPLPHG